MRWFAAGAHFGKVPQTLLHWRDRPHRLTRTEDRYRVMAFHRAKAPFLAAFLRQKVFSTGRAVWVWGAGRKSRRYLQPLLAQGISIRGFIDVKRRVVPGYPVRLPAELPSVSEAFLLSYVANRGIGEEVAAFLEQKGFEAERDYFLCA